MKKFVYSCLTVLFLLVLGAYVFMLLQHTIDMRRNSVRYRMTAWAYFSGEVNLVPIFQPLDEPLYSYSEVEGNAPRCRIVSYETQAKIATLKNVMKTHFQSRGAVLQSEGNTDLDFKDDRNAFMVRISPSSRGNCVSVFCLDLGSVSYH